MRRINWSVWFNFTSPEILDLVNLKSAICIIMYPVAEGLALRYLRGPHCCQCYVRNYRCLNAGKKKNLTCLLLTGSVYEL
jgi:hypothetical protein